MSKKQTYRSGLGKLISFLIACLLIASLVPLASGYANSLESNEEETLLVMGLELEEGAPSESPVPEGINEEELLGTQDLEEGTLGETPREGAVGDAAPAGDPAIEGSFESNSPNEMTQDANGYGPGLGLKDGQLELITGLPGIPPLNGPSNSPSGEPSSDPLDSTTESPEGNPGGEAFSPIMPLSPEPLPTDVIDGSSDTTITTSGGIYSVLAGNSNKTIIVNNATCTLVLHGVNRANGFSTLRILGSSNVTLYLVEGKVNSFTTTNDNGVNPEHAAGIVVESGSTLTISGPGTLQATGRVRGAGIGGSTTASNANVACGTIIINSGTVTATGGQYGAGIGGSGHAGSGGKVTINGGKVQATGGQYGAGIGGGQNGSGDTVLINGGEVSAQGGIFAAGIGGGYHGASGGTITINSGATGAVTAIGGSNGGAGIGGGQVGGGGTITIHSGTVVATGGSGGGAGIGGGGAPTSPSGSRGGAGGNITINGGHITASAGAGGAAGIGGGMHAPNNTVIITGGTVVASGSPVGTGGGSGIGGGGGNTGNLAPGGNIYISGGTITTRAFGSSSSIGGGFNSPGQYIEISGGIIDARTTSAGTGIGAGGGSSCGIINISGGLIYAKGSNQAAGIGAGMNPTSTGTINISGGIIKAECESPTSSGVGGGTDSTVAVSISGGSVYSANSLNMIRVNFSPKNGSALGNRLVYMIGVEVKNEHGLLPNTDISVFVEGGIGGAPDYNYRATSNELGIAYLWLPAGTHDFVMYSAEYGTYLDYRMQVTVPSDPTQYDPKTNIGEIILSSGRPEWSLSGIDSQVKAYGNATLHVDINHNNLPSNGDKRAIVDVRWYRESLEDPQNSQTSFGAGYSAASSGNKGIGGSGQTLDLSSNSSTHVHEYTMDIDRNGRYWIQIHYKGANTGRDIVHVTYIDISNVYTPVNVFVQDWSIRTNSAIKPYTKLVLEQGAPYGMPFDFDGTTLLEDPPLGFDQITYTRNASVAAPTWSMIVPVGPFEATPLDASSAQIILDAGVYENEDQTVNSSLTNKYYTVHYGIADSWHVVTTHYIDDSGTEIGTPSSKEHYVQEGHSFSLAAWGGIPSIADYTFENWKIGSGATLQNNSSIEVANITEETDINLIYYGQSSLTISHLVTGPYSNSSKEFIYTVYFVNNYLAPLAAGTELSILGSSLPNSNIAAPASGVLVLNDQGSATFGLKHGQSLEILGLSLGSHLRIVAENDLNYVITFKDSIASATEEGHDTGGLDGSFRPMTANRIFDFSNTRKEVVEAGITLGDFEIFILVPMTISATVLTILATRRLRIANRREGCNYERHTI